MSLTPAQFRVVANIIKKEGASNEAQEYLWLAHTANNHARARGRTLYNVLMSNYSTVPNNEKTELPDTDRSATAVAARAAVQNVVDGGADPTGGARFWDGTDFLAWGLNSPNGTPHNKFEEYSSITIPALTFNTYLASNQRRYGTSVRYSGTRYALPAAVFNDAANWFPQITIPFVPIPNLNRFVGFFRYTTGRSGHGLSATGSFGLSIFWRLV